MAREIIDIGTTGNDGTGDDLRTGAIKINNNFQELYSDVGALQAASGDSVDGIGFADRGIRFEGDSPDDAYQTFLKVINPTADRTIYLPNDSGTVALLSDITDTVDSAYIALRTGVAQDSAITLILIQANSIDSAEAIALIDSAYIQSRSFIADSDGFLTKLGEIKGNIVPAVDSAYDLGDSNYKWKDLYLSGKTIHLGGQTIRNNGSSFIFSQELATGPNNMSVDSGNGFFVNLYSNIATAWRTGTYATQQNSMKIEGNTIQLATVDGIVTSELHANADIFNFGWDSTPRGGTLAVPTITTNQRVTTAANNLFRGKGSISYNTDSNRFNLYDNNGWFSIKRDMIDANDISTTVDSDYVQTRADHLKLRVYTVASAPVSANAGEVIYVSNGNSGAACLAVYDGSNWKRIALGTTIST